MIKKPVIRIISFLMAILVLASTISFTIEKHYCGDHLVDVGVFVKAQKCGMEKMDEMVEKTMSKSCCSDTVEHLEGQDELQLSTAEEIDFESFTIYNNAEVYYSHFREFLPQKRIPYEFYDPPRLVRDILTLDSVLLI